MSQSYEDYSRTSTTYDDNRAPVGLQLIRDAVAAARPASGPVRVLDAGCGTGAYLEHLQDYGGALLGLELNAGMLARAQRKLAGYRGVELVQGSVLSMPFGDAELDLVMFNQVLHHLDGEGGGAGDWPSLRAALGEAQRVLRPGGTLLINTCSQQQLTDGFWYTPLIPAAVDRIARRYVPIPALRQVLGDLGFAAVDATVPKDEVFYGRRALDPTGPLDPAWRNGDSIWALTTEAELGEALSRLQAMLEQGQAEAFIAEREITRERVGQCVVLRAHAPGNRPKGGGHRS